MTLNGVGAWVGRKRETERERETERQRQRERESGDGERGGSEAQKRGDGREMGVKAWQREGDKGGFVKPSLPAGDRRADRPSVNRVCESFIGCTAGQECSL